MYGLLWAVAGVEIGAYVAGWASEAVAVRRAGKGRGERRGSGEALVGGGTGGTETPVSVGEGRQEVGPGEAWVGV